MPKNTFLKPLSSPGATMWSAPGNRGGDRRLPKYQNYMPGNGGEPQAFTTLASSAAKDRVS